MRYLAQDFYDFKNLGEFFSKKIIPQEANYPNQIIYRI